MILPALIFELLGIYSSSFHWVSPGAGVQTRSLAMVIEAKVSRHNPDHNQISREALGSIGDYCNLARTERSTLKKYVAESHLSPQK